MTAFNALDIAYVVAYFDKENTPEEVKVARKAKETKSNKPKRTGTRTHLVAKFVKCLRAQCEPQWEHKYQIAKIKKQPILLGYSYWLLK